MLKILEKSGLCMWTNGKQVLNSRGTLFTCLFFFFFLEFLLSFTESWRLESLLSSHSCSCPGSAWTFPGLRTQPFLFTIGSGILFDTFHYSFSLSHTFCFHSLTVVMNPSPLINMEGKLTCNSQMPLERILSVNLWKNNLQRSLH